MTNVLVVTTTERVLYWILCHTSNLGPAVSLHSILMVGTSSLEERLVGTATSGNNTNLGTNIGRDSLLTSRGKTETGSSLFFVVGDNNCEAARSTSKGTTVTNLGFNVAHDGTLRNLLQWKNISNSQGGLLTAVDELTSVHALGGNHKLGVALVSVGIQELDLGHGSATTGVMDDFLDNTADVSTTFRIIDSTELNGPLTSADVGFENGGLTLPLRLLLSNNR
jgi:hypothetical protein